MTDEARLNCCYNEEKKEWYDMVSISPDKFMCAGCNKTYKRD